MTVTGEVPGEQLGPTSAHEHLYCDISVHSGREDNILTDVPLMVGELAYVRRAGGRTIVDVTPEGIGRNPAMLKAISEGSGVQVVSGIAFYTEETYPAWVRGATEAQIADYFVREIEEGRDGVRAGLIGELASHNAERPEPAAYRLTEGKRTCSERQPWPSGAPAWPSPRTPRWAGAATRSWRCWSRPGPTRAGWRSATATRIGTRTPIRTWTTTCRSWSGARSAASI